MGILKLSENEEYILPFDATLTDNSGKILINGRSLEDYPVVKVVNKSSNELPKYESSGAAGLDIRAYLENPIYLQSNEISIIPTGIFIELPYGYKLDVRPRSGLAAKEYKIAILGTVDCDYRGEVGIILKNDSDKVCEIKNGDRIAQLVITQVNQILWKEVTELGITERNTKGFGSSGVK